jgi:hypothetical protein
VPERPLSADDAAELKRLYVALPEAIRRAGQILKESGALDERYAAQDAEVAQMIARINELMSR